MSTLVETVQALAVYVSSEAMHHDNSVPVCYNLSTSRGCLTRTGPDGARKSQAPRVSPNR